MNMMFWNRKPKLARGAQGRGPIAGEGWLVAHSLVKSYGGRTVVQGVSVAVGRGESVGILGPNGAGKTTTFYMVTGLVRP
jgi:lipopolysaccharide export system ATP-binding protein